MRIRQALLSCAVSISFSITMAPPAVAQSFFQKLFGIGGGQAAPQGLARPQGRTIPAHRFEYRPRPYQQSRPDYGDDEIGPPDSGGPYRTMCVRSCDGYFFPLRHDAKRRNFASDAKSCRAACGTEARLFYYSLNGGSTETMVDLAGRRYKDLPHAFGYRKALVQGCACKPVPWSYEEAARHRQYEEAEAASADAKASTASETAKTQADPAATAQMEPSSIQAAADKGVEAPSAPHESAVKAADTSASIPVQASSDTIAPQASESYEPIRIKPEKAVVRRRKLKDTRTVARRVLYQRTYQPASDWGIFGKSVSKD